MTNGTNMAKKKAASQGELTFNSQIIPLSKLYLETSNVRDRIDEESLRELKESFRQIAEQTDGTRYVIQPIAVSPLAKDHPEREHGFEWGVNSGFRRAHAAADLVRAKVDGPWMGGIPAVVSQAEIQWAGEEEVVDKTRLLEQFTENAQREKMNALDEAHALQALKEAYGLKTHAQVGKLVGKGKSYVQQHLALLRLPAPIQSFLKDGVISRVQARALCAIKPKSRQLDIADKVVAAAEKGEVLSESKIRQLDAAATAREERKAQKAQEEAAEPASVDVSENSAPTEDAQSKEPAEYSDANTSVTDVIQEAAPVDEVPPPTPARLPRDPSTIEFEEMCAEILEEIQETEEDDAEYRGFLHGVRAFALYYSKKRDTMFDWEKSYSLINGSAEAAE